MIISVIIPTYGMPKFLESAIKSVQNQTIADWELIIVDDNNPDTEARRITEELVGSFCAGDDRIRYFVHPKNLNGAVARNTGIAEASGEFIAFLDSDDQYMPDRFEKCLAVMATADHKIAGVYTGCEFRRNGSVYNTVIHVLPGNFLRETLACTFMLCTGSNLFLRRSVVNEINGFDGAFLRHQDYEFLVRIFERYDLSAIQEALVIKNNDNLNLPDVEKLIAIKRQYLEKYADIIKQLSEAEQHRIYHSQYIQIAEAALRSGKREIAQAYYKRASMQERLTLKEQARRLAFSVIRK